MKQSAYLFLGGPLDQQWREVPRGHLARVVAVECGDGMTTSRMVNYYHGWMFAPGWLVPIAVYSTDPMLSPSIGTPLPGWIQGARPESSLLSPHRWFDGEGHLESRRALHTAIKRRGFRP